MQGGVQPGERAYGSVSPVRWVQERRCASVASALVKKCAYTRVKSAGHVGFLSAECCCIVCPGVLYVLPMFPASLQKPEISNMQFMWQLIHQLISTLVHYWIGRIAACEAF
eukprot:1157779-Pelagomonas_calceolata.AAC.20